MSGVERRSPAASSLAVGSIAVALVVRVDAGAEVAVELADEAGVLPVSRLQLRLVVSHLVLKGVHPEKFTPVSCECQFRLS